MKTSFLLLVASLVVFAFMLLIWGFTKGNNALTNDQKAQDFEVKARLFREKGPTFYRVADSLEVLSQYYQYKADEAIKDLPKWLRE